MTELQIEQFRPSDEDALLSFLRAAYPDDPRRSDRAFWRWHFLEHPHVRRDDIPIWLVKDGQRIAAQLAAIPAALKIGDESERAIWIMDVYVHQDYRRRGLARRLWLAAGESYSRMFGLGINEQSKAVVMGLSWVEMGHIHRYHRLLFPGDALGNIQKLGALRELVNLGYAPFRRRLARRARQAAGTGGAVREVREFDASFDDLWRRACAQWPCAVARDARYLEWQFMRQPGKRFDVLGLYSDERLTGYVVLFFRKPEQAGAPPKAAITDLCYDASATRGVIDELLKAALRLALERRAGSLVTDVLDLRVEERLRAFGFRRIKAAPEFIANGGAPPLMYDPGNWFLTRADSDVSIFEQPNL